MAIRLVEVTVLTIFIHSNFGKRDYIFMISKQLMIPALVLGIGAVTSLAVHQGWAADHLDPPGRTDPDSSGTDRAADIADLFAWHTSDSVVLALSYDGPNMAVAGQKVSCDRDVLYTINVSNDDDLDPEFSITARFGLDDGDRCFVSFDGIPGTGGNSVVGATDRELQWRDTKAFAGLRDDAFFFDLAGFRETLTTGDIKMTDDRDSFAGANASALVVEFPLAAVSPGGESFRVWATTARIGN